MARRGADRSRATGTRRRLEHVARTFLRAPVEPRRMVVAGPEHPRATAAVDRLLRRAATDLGLAVADGRAAGTGGASDRSGPAVLEIAHVGAIDESWLRWLLPPPAAGVEALVWTATGPASLRHLYLLGMLAWGLSAHRLYVLVPDSNAEPAARFAEVWQRLGPTPSPEFLAVAGVWDGPECQALLQQILQGVLSAPSAGQGVRRARTLHAWGNISAP